MLPLSPQFNKEGIVLRWPRPRQEGSSLHGQGSGCLRLRAPTRARGALSRLGTMVLKPPHARRVPLAHRRVGARPSQRLLVSLVTQFPRGERGPRAISAGASGNTQPTPPRGQLCLTRPAAAPASSSGGICVWPPAPALHAPPDPAAAAGARMVARQESRSSRATRLLLCLPWLQLLPTRCFCSSGLPWAPHPRTVATHGPLRWVLGTRCRLPLCPDLTATELGLMQGRFWLWLAWAPARRRRAHCGGSGPPSRAAKACGCHGAAARPRCVPVPVVRVVSPRQVTGTGQLW